MALEFAANGSFAIVCDSACDLTPEFLERLGVACVLLENDRVEDFGELYEGLVSSGVMQIASVHSDAPVIAQVGHIAGHLGDGVHVEIVEVPASSAACGMVVERLAAARAAGVEFSDAVPLARALAGASRKLVIPASDSPFMAMRAQRRHHTSLVARASALKVRLTGERMLFLVGPEGTTCLARSTSFSELGECLAQAMVRMAQTEGPLVHVLVHAGESRAADGVDAKIEAAGVDSTRLGMARTCGTYENIVGKGAIAVCFAPKEAYLQAGASPARIEST